MNVTQLKLSFKEARERHDITLAEICADASIVVSSGIVFEVLL